MKVTCELAWSALLLLVSFSCKGVLSYSHNPVQYHIQTDTGPDRYFRFQTYDGQYRKEKRFEDGTVIGTYGWVDPTGLLRLYDYIADTKGYRIARTRIMKVTIDQPSANEIKATPEKVSYKRQGPLPASSNVRKVLPIYNYREADATKLPLETTTFPSETTTIPTTTTSTESYSPVVVEETTITSRPKLRPLFVKRKKQQDDQTQNKFTRRRENFSSMRQQVRQQLLDKQEAINENEVQYHNEQVPQVLAAPSVPSFSPPRRQTTRNQVFIPQLKLPSENNPTFLPSESLAEPDLGYNNAGGRVSIDFDLGNQYRKEKVFPDGTVVGEHGYVDPMGILRITYYKSGGSEGQQEFKKNYWVGTRLPGS